MKNSATGNIGAGEEKIAVADQGGTELRIGKAKNGSLDETSLQKCDSPKSFLKLIERIQRYINQFPGLAGIVICLAGVIDGYARVKISPNLPFLNEKDVKAKLEDALGITVWIVNDMLGATLAERKFGMFREHRWGIFQTLSTGIGGCQILNGEIVAGEPGHTFAGERYIKNLCGCGLYGHNESAFSGNAIKSRVIDYAASQRLIIPSETHPCAWLSQQADLGEQWSLDLLEELGIGIARAWLQMLNCNSKLEIIGVMGTFGLKMLRHIRPHIERQIRLEDKYQNSRTVQILETKLSPYGGLLGAAVAWERIEAGKSLNTI